LIRDITKKVRRLLGYAANTKFHMMAGILGFSVRGLLGVWMIADFLGNATQAIENNNSAELCYALLWAMPWLAAILAIQALSTWLTGVTTASMTVSMRKHLMEVMIFSPLQSANSSHSGTKLSYYTNDIPAATNSIVKTLTIPVEALVIGIGCFIYVISVHWMMAVISVAIGIFTYIYSILFAKHLHRIAVRMQQFRGILEVRIKTLLDGMVTARMYGMKDKLESEMNEASEDLMKTGISWAWLSGFLGGVNNVVSRLSSNILIFAAGWLFLSNIVSLPELMRVSHMAGGVIGVFHISRLLVDIQKSLAGCDRIFEYIDSTEKEVSRNFHREHDLADPIISFENVTFGYDDSAPIITNLSFKAHKGEMIALIGRSGGGKSTVLRLAQGLYEKQAGDITVSGIPLDQWNLHALRNMASLVPQEPVLFPGTIAQNIALGCDGFDMSMIEQAAKDAGAHNFISAMPEGYDTMVSERGNSLSGGQRQRIAIARALYRETPILLLDEATSAMDSESEAVVYETLRRLKGNKTILFVTHRASALNIADKMITIP